MANLTEEMKEALEKRAKGYDTEERKVYTDKNGRPLKVEIIKKHIPGEPVVARMILNEIENGRW